MLEKNNVWANEIEAAEHYKLKPGTLRKNISKWGHSKGLVWKKVGGKILYNLEHNDKLLEERGVI